jgi:hypoxanthine phosphoribosyltransferase
MQLDWKSFLSAIIISLIVAAISSFLVFLIRQILISGRKKEVLHWILLITVGISGFIVIYEITQTYRENVLSIGQFLFILLVLLIHWGTGSLAYLVTRLQYGRKFKVQGKSGDIYIRRLYSAPPGKNLWLNWKTFSDGMKFLMEQIGQQRKGGASFCVGINNAGGAIASLLAGFIGKLDPLPVYVAIAKGNRQNLDHFKQSLPDEKEPTILVVDVQVQTGVALKKIVDLLEEKYEQKTRILKAVLTVAPVRGSIQNIQEIKIAGTFKQDPKYLPDYVAFIHASRSVRLPEKIQ